MLRRRTRTHLPTTDKLLSSAYGSTIHDALVKAKARQSTATSGVFRGAGGCAQGVIGDCAMAGVVSKKKVVKNFSLQLLGDWSAS
jgi:hypothetical protein